MEACDFDALYRVLADSDNMQHYSFMKGTNEPSARTAMAHGCRHIEEFMDEENEITEVFMISKDEWMK